MRQRQRVVIDRGYYDSSLVALLFSFAPNEIKKRERGERVRERTRLWLTDKIGLETRIFMSVLEDVDRGKLFKLFVMMKRKRNKHKHNTK